MDNTYGNYIGLLLKDRKMTQRELAEKIGVTESAVSCYIRGKRTPSLFTMQKIADALNVSLGSFLDKDVNYLGEAQHNEPECVELADDDMIDDNARFTLTPKGIAYCALQEADLLDPEDRYAELKFNCFFNRFEIDMRKCGYIIEGD